MNKPVKVYAETTLTRDGSDVEVQIEAWVSQPEEDVGEVGLQLDDYVVREIETGQKMSITTEEEEYVRDAIEQAAG